MGQRGYIKSTSYPMVMAIACDAVWYLDGTVECQMQCPTLHHCDAR